METTLLLPHQLSPRRPSQRPAPRGRPLRSATNERALQILRSKAALTRRFAKLQTYRYTTFSHRAGAAERTPNLICRAIDLARKSSLTLQLGDEALCLLEGQLMSNDDRSIDEVAVY